MQSILIVTNSRTGGGAERAMNVLAQALHLQNLQVQIISINSSNYDLVKPDCVDINLGRPTSAGLRETLKYGMKLRSLAAHFNPDVILLNCDLPELLGLFIRQRNNIFIVEHTSKPFFNRRIIGFILRWVHRLRRSRFVGITDDAIVWPFNIKPIFFVSNSIDPRAIATLQDSDHSNAVTMERLIFIGRLSHEKAPMMFVEIARRTGLSGLIIGDGPLLSEIKSNAPINIEILGHVTDPWSYVKKTDLIVVTSEIEGDGLVISESIINGVPVVLRDNYDLRRFRLPEENYAADIESFCERINEFRLGKINLKVSNQISQVIQLLRDPGRIAKLWIMELERYLESH